MADDIQSTSDNHSATAETNEQSFHRDLSRSLLEAIRERDEGDPEADLETRAEAHALLYDAWRENASDIHLDPQDNGLWVRLRIDGVVLKTVALDNETGMRLVNQLKTMADINPVAMLAPQDGRFSHRLDDRDYNFRITCTPCIDGEKLAIRALNPERVRYQLHELGLQNEDMENIGQWLNQVRGMLLVAGPTGSGKTTTLYALLHKLRYRQSNVMTIEDPVEYSVTGVNQVQVNREQGLDFADGVRTLLRLDPDYMLLGEIRGEASLRAAFDAAVSGRALMASLHCHDAVSAVTVLRNYGLDSREISSNLELIIAQRLVRKLCTHCREQSPPTEEEAHWLGSIGVDVPDKTWHARGCGECRQVGYRGRIGIFEVWRIAEEDYSAILEGADERKLRNHLAERRHCFLIDDALNKVANGITSLEEIRPIGGFGPLGPVTRAHSNCEPSAD